MQRVCFDHLSGAPAESAVIEAMLPWLRERCASTGAVHSGGVEARAALDIARDQAAAFLHASSPEEIIFTSSGTESLNLAVKGCAWANQRRGKHIVLSAIEHPAVTSSIEFLESLGFTATRVDVSSEGLIDPSAIAEAIREDTILVCVHAGHHDIGAIQTLVEIGNATAERGPALLVDATYAAGWMPIDAQAIGASCIALAPHRFGGPNGVGVLYKQRRARLTSLIHGGAQELGWRAGTENIAGIVGAGVACTLQPPIAHVRALQAQMWNGLQTLEGIRLNGPPLGATRLPNSLNVSVRGVEGEGLALALDMKGYAITSGQACTTKAEKIPPVLAALGVSEEFAAGTVIASFGKSNTAAEVDAFLITFTDVVAKLRAMAAE